MLVLSSFLFFMAGEVFDEKETRPKTCGRLVGFPLCSNELCCVIIPRKTTKRNGFPTRRERKI